MTPGDVFRHLETGDYLTLESVTAGGTLAACYWFDDAGYHWQYVAVNLLMPVLASCWPIPE